MSHLMVDRRMHEPACQRDDIDLGLAILPRFFPSLDGPLFGDGDIFCADSAVRKKNAFLLHAANGAKAPAAS